MAELATAAAPRQQVITTYVGLEAERLTEFEEQVKVELRRQGHDPAEGDALRFAVTRIAEVDGEPRLEFGGSDGVEREFLSLSEGIKRLVSPQPNLELKALLEQLNRKWTVAREGARRDRLYRSASEAKERAKMALTSRSGATIKAVETWLTRPRVTRALLRLADQLEDQAEKLLVARMALAFEREWDQPTLEISRVDGGISLWGNEEPQRWAAIDRRWPRKTDL